MLITESAETLKPGRGAENLIALGLAVGCAGSSLELQCVVRCRQCDRLTAARENKRPLWMCRDCRSAVQELGLCRPTQWRHFGFGIFAQATGAYRESSPAS